VVVCVCVCLKGGRGGKRRGGGRHTAKSLRPSASSARSGSAPAAAAAAVAHALVPRRQHFKHGLDRLGRAQEGVHLAVVHAAAQLAPRHHPVCKAPHLLGLGQRGAYPAVRDQRLYNVAEERLAVCRVAPKLAVADLVAHGSAQGKARSALGAPRPGSRVAAWYGGAGGRCSRLGNAIKKLGICVFFPSPFPFSVAAAAAQS
jgi:hypothetical protein